jgi:electron transfer flavoprotein alpha subunit
MSEIWAFSEKGDLLAELLGGARDLAGDTGDSLTAVVLGPREACDAALKAGANSVLWLGEPGSNMVEDYVPTLAGLVKAREPRVFLIGASKSGKALAGRLAARLGASVIADLKRFVVEGAEVCGEHLIFGGGAVQLERSKSNVTLATAGYGIFEAAELNGGTGDVEEVPFHEPEWRLTLREVKEKPPSSVNLAAAKRVVCAGLGVKQEADLDMIRELASALGAEVGCTRPLAEGLDWLPRERYIGVSGAMLKPELYVGIGVSGQVQHTVGIVDSRIVVAINKDEKAAIFEQSDYGIVGDLYKVVPVLTEALKKR